MLDNILENKIKIHTRDIQLATYPHTDSRVIVHGVLKDKRYIRIFDVTGAVIEPGIIHHMDVKLLIKPVPKDLKSLDEKNFLIDSCRLWTRQGAKMKSLEQAIKARHSF